MKLFATTRARINARTQYMRTGLKTEGIYAALSQPAARSARQRARLLTDWSVLEARLADLRTAGYAHYGEREQLAGGQTVTTMHQHTARILQLIASTEIAEGPYHRDEDQPYEKALGPILDQLTTTKSTAIRAELMDRLYLAAHPVIGGDAAEVIETLRRIYLHLALNHPAPLTRKADA